LNGHEDLALSIARGADWLQLPEAELTDSIGSRRNRRNGPFTKFLEAKLDFFIVEPYLSIEKRVVNSVESGLD
jgi:hypothetical protein